ncbi:MAG: metal ABC transporter permease [Tissierellia bacterium]|nr:metal ABC transporter permease [Tissierellia bacterium]
MAIFEYNYMIRALLVGLALGIIIPMMGMVIVNRNLSSLGDALSHVSLAGVMFGAVAGINPVLGAVLASVLAGLSIEFIRRRFPSHGEVATAIIMSTGVGLASLLSGFIKGATNFESFLFGSIVAISDFEFYMILAVSALVFLLMGKFYHYLMVLSFDPISAAISGIPVGALSGLFIVLTALTVAISGRTVGVLIISSLLVLPVASALQLKLNYKRTTLVAVVFGILFTQLGLILSFYLGLKPGGTIVLLGVATLLLLFAYTALRNRKP